MLTYPRIDPIIFSLGPLHVRWYGLMYIFGFIACYLLVSYQARRFQFNRLTEHLDNLNIAGIAGVILGGGEFVGGRVSPTGAVLGALTLTLTGSFLIFLKISPDWQIGAQGGILILVLALRALINRREAHA